MSTKNSMLCAPAGKTNSVVAVVSATVVRPVCVTTGNYFFSENQFLPTGGTGITFTRYYNSGSIFNTFDTTIVPSNVYNSGSALIAMSSSYYTKHTLYVVGQGTDEQYFLVVGQNQYATLIETENADLPLPPTYFSDGVVSIASIYAQSGSANIVQIEDIRPVIGFKASGINASSVHGNLLGLSADDHTQYLLVDGAREMAANLGLGGFDIYNVDSITATSITSSFTGSLTGTASYASNALSSSYAENSSLATSSSYALTASIALKASGSLTGSLLGTASYASQALTASNANTASIATSSSYALTASFALNAGGASGVTVADEGVTQGTAEYLDFTGAGVSVNLVSNTASIIIPGGVTSPFPYTGSAIITGSLEVVGPIEATLGFSGSFSGSFQGNGSQLTGITATAAPAGPNTSIQFNDNGATSGSGNFEFDKTTNSVTLTGSLYVTGSNTAPVQYIWLGTAVGANGTIWTNQPVATASFGNATSTNVSSSVYIGDFTTSTQCRLFTAATVVGAATATLLVQYSLDGNTWESFTPALLTGNTLGKKDTDWNTLPEGAKTFVYIRLVGYGGNGTADPAMSPPILLVR